MHFLLSYQYFQDVSNDNLSGIDKVMYTNVDAMEGGIHKMEISPYYDKKHTCLNCQQSFLSTKVRSRSIRIAQHDSDFKPNYAQPEINPLFYNVAVCPHCGFSFTEEFSPYFSPGTKEAIQQQITNRWNGRSLGHIRSIEEAIETYKLAFLCANVKKENALTKAGLTLRIAWLHREQAEADEEQRFLKVARDFYIQAFSEGDYVGTQMSETRVVYLIAELSWRIGDREEAIRNFSRVIEKQRTSTEPHLVNTAKERWQEIRSQTAKEEQ